MAQATRARVEAWEPRARTAPAEPRGPWLDTRALRNQALGIGTLLALLLLKLAPLKQAFALLNEAMLSLDRATAAGTAFVFGYLGGAPLPFAETGPGSSFVLAFRALPLVLVISALSALLFHWRILPLLVQAFARVLQRALGIGGAVGVSTAANVFVGMVEAPLFIRPYLLHLARGEARDWQVPCAAVAAWLAVLARADSVIVAALTPTLAIWSGPRRLRRLALYWAAFVLGGDWR